MKDPRIILGGGFILFYYASLWVIGFRIMPDANVALIKDAMLQLGPPVGIIIGALFRSDRADELRAENTGKGFDAIAAQVQANNEAATGKPDDPVHTIEETKS